MIPEMDAKNVEGEIFHVVAKAFEIADDLTKQHDLAESMRVDLAVDAVRRNTDTVQAMSAESAQKIGALLTTFALQDRRHSMAADEIGAGAFHAAEQIKAMAMEFAQHFATMKSRARHAEYVLSTSKDRFKEHSINNGRVRKEVLNSTGGACFYCETQVWDANTSPDGGDPATMFHVDHIVARVHGGPDHISNFVPACAKCNSSKGDRPFVQFVRRRNVKLRVVNGGPE